jgi:hypothetical protein
MKIKTYNGIEIFLGVIVVLSFLFLIPGGIIIYIVDEVFGANFFSGKIGIYNVVILFILTIVYAAFSLLLENQLKKRGICPICKGDRLFIDCCRACSKIGKYLPEVYSK